MAPGFALSRPPSLLPSVSSPPLFILLSSSLLPYGSSLHHHTLHILKSVADSVFPVAEIHPKVRTFTVLEASDCPRICGFCLVLDLMRIGARLLGHHDNHAAAGNAGAGHRIGYISSSKVIRKKRRVRRLNRGGPPMLVVLQELFDACRDIFKGPGTVSPPGDVQRLSSILDNMKPEDVGLRGELQFFKTNKGSKAVPRVTHTTIYKCSNFSLCLFFLPPGGVIPLHNHPEMTVFSKLLLGSMHIKSYDWAHPTDSSKASAEAPHLRLARVKADGVFTAPCNSSVLYPTTGGNIHAVTALTPCAFLDVIGPPYSKEDGRDCSYYKEYPYSAFSNGEIPPGKEEGQTYGWLEEIDVPENSHMDGIEYLGPQVVDSSSG